MYSISIMLVVLESDQETPVSRYWFYIFCPPYLSIPFLYSFLARFWKIHVSLSSIAALGSLHHLSLPCCLQGRF